MQEERLSIIPVDACNPPERGHLTLEAIDGAGCLGLNNAADGRLRLAAFPEGLKSNRPDKMIPVESIKCRSQLLINFHEEPLSVIALDASFLLKTGQHPVVIK